MLLEEGSGLVQHDHRADGVDLHGLAQTARIPIHLGLVRQLTGYEDQGIQAAERFGGAGEQSVDG